ncbi:MAG: thioredoxin domain-containing protein [Deltaproteobacteria bacterium]|nr:thioredoxin domain-containing protein [Deltaproteobacteria bacterium]
MLSKATAVVFLITTLVLGYLYWDVKNSGTHPGAQNIAQVEGSAPFTGSPEEQKQRISNYLRETLNMPSSVQIEVGEIQTSDIPGLQEGELNYQRGEQAQKGNFYLTSDGNYLILGRVMNLAVDPRQAVVSKISMKDAVIQGAKDAPVTLVEYSDLQCPFCGRAHKTVEELVKANEGKLKWVWKHFPLSTIHKWAEDGAVAAECVRQQNEEAFWKFADYVFENQKSINNSNLEQKVGEFAQQNGLKDKKIKSCMKDKNVREKVQADAKEGGEVGVSSTPTFFVNGRKVSGAKPLAEFQSIVDEELGIKKPEEAAPTTESGAPKAPPQG